MTKWLAIALVVSRAGIVAAGVFHASPPVKVIEVAPSTAGNATVQLVNDSSSDVVASSIVAEAGCDAAIVHASPAGPFTLTPGVSRTITVSCSAAPAGMRRCTFGVLSPSGSVLLDFEGVCEAAGSTTLMPDSPAVDLGSVAIGSSATRTLTFTNTGGAAFDHVHFETTDLDGNFVVGMPCNPDDRECDPGIATVNGGGTFSANVRCTPQAAGTLTTALYVSTSAGTRLVTPVMLTCTGTPAATPVIALAPTAIDAGAVEVINATAGRTVRVRNVGASVLRVTSAMIVDAGTGTAADWSVTASGACNGVVPCGLDPGAELDLAAVFDPSALGARNAILLVNYHDIADRSVSVPLRGLGRGVTLDVIGRIATLDFGVLPINVTGTLTLQLANTGNRDVTDAMVTITPVGPPFAAMPASPFSVTTASAVTISVSCRPTVAVPITAMLEIAAPDALSAPIDIALSCEGSASSTLVGTPPAINLGEVRTSTKVVKHIGVASTTTPQQLDTATLETPNPIMTISGAPATTPAMIDLDVEPTMDGDLANRVAIMPSSGMPLSLAVTGAAVTATYVAPQAVSLGTFCVNQPTTARIAQLDSNGSGTLILQAPALALVDSPFDLAFTSPSLYPARLPASEKATVELTPRRQAFAGTVSDDLVWTTDAPGNTTAHTTVTASFIDNGGAIAPPALNFGRAPVHLVTRNSQQVTVQNCDLAPLEFDAPEIAAPFSIDSPSVPKLLMPGETATFSVGFRPTRIGVATQTLRLASQQLTMPLTVALTGEGVGDATGDDAGTTGPKHDGGSCLGCSSGDAATPLVLFVIVAIVLRRRSSSRSDPRDP